MHTEPVRYGYNNHATHSPTLSGAERWALAKPFAVVSALAIIGGGLIAAAIAHAPTRHAVWMVAYLVLVVGAAQLALGVGQALLVVEKPPAGLWVIQCGLFNAGNAGVIAGTMLDRFPPVAAGGVLLLVTLALFLYGVRSARRYSLLYAYQAVLVLISMSAIVGIILAAVR